MGQIELDDLEGSTFYIEYDSDTLEDQEFPRLTGDEVDEYFSRLDQELNSHADSVNLCTWIESNYESIHDQIEKKKLQRYLLDLDRDIAQFECDIDDTSVDIDGIPQAQLTESGGCVLSSSSTPNKSFYEETPEEEEEIIDLDQVECGFKFSLT